MNDDLPDFGEILGLPDYFDTGSADSVSVFNRGLAGLERIVRQKEGGTTESIAEVISCFDEYVEQKPDDAAAYVMRGIAKEMSNDMGGALQDSTTAITLKPKWGVAYFLRGKIKGELNDLEGAVIDLEKAHSLDQRQVFANELCYNLCMSAVENIEKGNHLVGKKLLIRIDALEINDIFAACAKGAIKAFFHDYTGAFKEFTQAIDYASNDKEKAVVYSLRGAIKRNMDDLDGSIEDFVEAYRLDPNKREICKNLKEVYLVRGEKKEDVGDYTGAIADYTSAIHIHLINSRVAYTLRALAREEMGDVVGAREDWKQVEEEKKREEKERD